MWLFMEQAIPPISVTCSKWYIREVPFVLRVQPLDMSLLNRCGLLNKLASWKLWCPLSLWALLLHYLLPNRIVFLHHSSIVSCSISCSIIRLATSHTLTYYNCSNFFKHISIYLLFLTFWTTS
jgi:hypothetical protein